MRRFGKLHRSYMRIEGESTLNPISKEQDLICDSGFINDFSSDEHLFGRFNFFSMLDYRYVRYKESINENFRPFKKYKKRW